MTEKKPNGLELIREKFPENTISKLPKPTKKQTDEIRADYKKGIRCEVCGGWHHPKVVHLDYVGHAALTDRLLNCDPDWNWEPVSFDDSGNPQFDNIGGMWIRLTVCGVTRLGYGSADGKTGGNAIKEVIGDALRNAAMRFGAALDLWHKGDLHDDSEDIPPNRGAAGEGMANARTDAVLDSLPEDASPRDKAAAFSEAIIADITKAKTSKGVNNAWNKWSKHIDALQGKHEDLYANVFDAWQANGGE